MILEMSASGRNREQDLGVLLKRATDLHGHFGPFLTLGVRMGIVGLRELGAEAGDTQLRITVMLEHSLPYSCMLDGLQTVTKCTVGNKRLTWKESKEFGASFLFENSGRKVEVKINPAIVHEVSLKLNKKHPSDKQVSQLGSEIRSKPENELFSVSHK